MFERDYLTDREHLLLRAHLDKSTPCCELVRHLHRTHQHKRYLADLPRMDY